MHEKSLQNIHTLTEDDLQEFETLKIYTMESHLVRKLLKHVPSGELYFYEFYEKIDWLNGNDPQYNTYIPVANETESDNINKLDLFEIHNITPRIIFDWKEDDTKTIHWIK